MDSISVVIPALNAEDSIKSCIDSLKNQKHPDYEIIVVDNGSTDNTQSIARSYGLKVLLEPKKGSYCARNRGITAAKGEIIAFTDADCIVSDDWLIRISQNFKKNTRIVGGPVRSLTTTSRLQRYCDKFCHTPSDRGFTTSNMAIQKKIINKFGGFRELISGGDFELCSRIIEGPGQVVFDHKAIVYHDYPDKLSHFIARFIKYGRGIGIIQKENGTELNQSGISYLDLLENDKIFIFYRIIQDISFRIGWLQGLLR